MALGLQHAITDICMIVEDLDRSIEFYERIGFPLRRRNEGFADFDAAGTTLALWEGKHLRQHVGFLDTGAGKPVHKVMAAIRVASPEIVGAIHAELAEQRIQGLTPPVTYEWNAFAIYFPDPDGNLWEVYAWGERGPYDAGVPPINKQKLPEA